MHTGPSVRKMLLTRPGEQDTVNETVAVHVLSRDCPITMYVKDGNGEAEPSLF